MQPPTTTPTIGEARRHESGRGYGMVLFASILLVVIGWITLIIGILQLLAAVGVLAGNQAARWFAVAMLGLNAIDQMLFIQAYPLWSVLIIAMDIIALYGLVAYGSRANLDAA